MTDLATIHDGLLGGTRSTFRLDSVDEDREAALALASQAKKSLYIYSRDLDPVLYDNQPFIDTVKHLATSNRHAKIQILIKDSTLIVARGHRLVTLARQLSSLIHLRKPNKEYRGYNEAFLIADEMGYLHRPMSDRYEGTLSFSSPIKSRSLLKFFHEVWERSEPDPELQRLHL